MIHLVFIFGVVLPTLITVVCFIGFLVCWFRFRYIKRHHVTDRKSLSQPEIPCPRRCRVFVASSSTSDVGIGGCRTAGCRQPRTGSSILTGSNIPVGWMTHLVDRRRDSVALPLTTNVINVDMPSTATAEAERLKTLFQHPGIRPDNFRSISGLRPSITSPGLLLTYQDCRKTAVSNALVQARTVACLSGANKVKPETDNSSSISRKNGGRPPSSQTMAVDACYVEVEPIIHAKEHPRTSCRRPRMSASKSVDEAVSKTTTSGLFIDRKCHCVRTSATHEMAPLAQLRRQHSLAEVPIRHELQVKTADHTSLDF